MCNKLLQNLKAGNNYFIAHDSVGQEFGLSSDGQFFCFQRHQLRWDVHPAGSVTGARVSKIISLICIAYELRWLEGRAKGCLALFPYTVFYLVGLLSLHRAPLSRRIAIIFHMAAGFQEGEVEASRPLEGLGCEVIRHHCCCILWSQQDMLRSKRKRSRAQLLMKVASACRDGRNCWEPSLQISIHQ